MATLRAFRRARAIIHREAILPSGPWPAVEGRLGDSLPPGATRLALHGPVPGSVGWELAYRRLHALWLGSDAEEVILEAMVGGHLQATLRRLWTGSIPVEVVLAAGRWPSLERLGGPLRDVDALTNVLHQAPRLATLDLDVVDPPPLAPLVKAGVRCIRLSAPQDPLALLAAPPPAGLRWFGLVGYVEDDVAAALAAWGPRGFACEPERPTGLAWLGY